MKLIILSLVLFIATLASNTPAFSKGAGYSSGDFAGKAVAKGDDVIFPQNLSDHWWNVQNPDGISGSKKKFAYGSQCQAKHGGVLTVIALDGEALLIRYSISGLQRGSKCPNGTLFHERTEKFNMVKWQRHIEAMYERNDQERKERIRKLIKD